MSRLRKLVLAAVASTTFMASTLVVIGGAASPAGATGPVPEWSPESLPLLSLQGGTGKVTPILTSDVLDGSFGVATSTQPILEWKNVPAGVGDVKFVIESLAQKNPTQLWSATGSVNGGTARVQVPEGKLSQGKTYRWLASAVNKASEKIGPFAVTVDTQRPDVQNLWGTGPIQVGEVSGEVVSSWSSSGISTHEGTAQFFLNYRPSNVSNPVLPAGWSLDPGSSSTNWDSLVVNGDKSVTLTSQTGVSITFVPTDGTATNYQPLFGPDTTWPNGSVSTLVPEAQADGSTSWTVTDQNRLVTVFSSTNATTKTARPTAVWSDQGLVLQQTWSNGKLQSIVDPTSNAPVYNFYYQGSPECPSTSNVSGALPTPPGMLCGASDWAGTTYGIYYVNTPAGPEVGRIVQGVGEGEAALVTDYKWDNSGRLAGVRPAATTSIVASKVISGLGNQDERAMYTVTYDGNGRVASVKSPAGLVPGSTETSAQTTQVTQSFSYEPFKANQNGRLLTEVRADVTNMLPTSETSSSGATATMTYDTATGNLLTQRDNRTGLATETIYNASGKPTEEIGPTTAGFTSSSAPKVELTYDQFPNGTPWTGLSTDYWNNATFSSAPVAGSTGPVLDSSGRAPGQLSFNWTTPPVTPGPTGWSARMSGNFLAGAEGNYVFTNETPLASVWINGTSCAPTCTIPLRENAQASVRIDISSAKMPTPGIKLIVTPPNGVAGVVSTASLRPALGYATSDSTFDSLGASSPSAIGASQKLTVLSTLDPTTGRVLAEQSPMGSTTTNSYLPDGSPASTTNPGGQSTSYSYFSGNQSLNASCSSSVPVNQRGLLSGISAPGGFATSYVYNADGSLVRTTQGALSACSGDASNPMMDLAATGGAGLDPVGSSAGILNNNPMVSYSVAVIGGHTSGVKTTVDLNGNIWKMVDEWGTTTTYTYSPQDGTLVSVVQTTKSGQSRTETYSYNSVGQLATTSVDGKVLETLSYNAQGVLSGATLANGVKVAFGYNNQMKQNSVSYTFANNSVASDRTTTSTGGRILCHVTTAHDGNATQCYNADKDGKIISATQSGSIPTTASNWSATFPGAQGANGDRASLTTTLTEKGVEASKATEPTAISTASYNSGDGITQATVNGIPQEIKTDGLGRVTQLGDLALTYDSAGDVLSATQGTSSVEYGYGSAGVNQENFTFEKAVKGQQKEKTSTTTSSTTSTSTSTTSTTTATTLHGSTTSTTEQPASSSTTSTTSSTTTTIHSTTSTTMPKVEEPTVTEKKHVEVRFSGDDLLLNDKGEIVGQTLSLASGVAVGLNGAGTPVGWNYPNVMGNTTWRSGENAIPSATILYDPWGTKISMDPSEEPTSAVALVMDGQGWGAGQGGVTLPLATGLVTLGSRTYVPELGRFIQADPQDGTNAYAYADNDPIDNTDSSGNSVTAGDIFSWIFSIGLGIVIGALAPVTLGGSSVLAGVVFTAVAASLDFVGSVAGQLIDNGGNFSQINWAQAGINAGIGAGLVGGGFVIGRLAIYPIRMGAKLAAQSRRAAALNMLLPGEESLAARGGWKVGARSYLTWGGSHGEATGLQRFVRLMRGGNRPPPAPTGIAMEDLLNPAYVENLFDGLKPGAMGTKESIKMGSGGVQQVAQVQNPVVASQRSSSSSLAKSLQIDDAEYQKMLRDFIKAHGYS